MHYIWMDCRENKSKPYLKGYRLSCSFEGYTGADLIITPRKGSISKSNMQEHLNEGAVMIQVKHGIDLIRSIYDQRYTEAISRMSAFDAASYQKGLLITGDFTFSDTDVYFEGRKQIAVNPFLGALNVWVLRGGVIYPSIPLNHLQTFVDLLGNKLYNKDPFYSRPKSRSRRTYKPKSTFTEGKTIKQRIQTAKKAQIPTHDPRHLLINIDGVSTDIVGKIWSAMQAAGVQMNFSGFIHLLLSDELLKIKGIGPKINQKIKEQLGYYD